MSAVAFKGQSVAAALCLLLASGVVSAQTAPDLVKRGAYVFAAAGCLACHTDLKNKGPLLAGGGALKTPFGTFYGPNITPDMTHGIGRWTDADFIRALREGVSPSGADYFPVFPYPTFTRMTDADMVALGLYLYPAGGVPAQQGT